MEYLTVAKRNRLIKKALSVVFGKGNVSVKRGSGFYGSIDIEINTKKPHDGECDSNCPLCKDEANKVGAEVWRILEDSELNKTLYTYYDNKGRKYQAFITYLTEIE